MAKTIALAKVGMDSGTRASEALPNSRETETKNRLAVAATQTDEQLDHFVTQDGVTFAGTHLILDLWGCTGLDDEELIDRAFRKAIEVSGATLLHIHLHRFLPSGGISGVAVLAESHISIHTWPERPRRSQQSSGRPASLVRWRPRCRCSRTPSSRRT